MAFGVKCLCEGFDVVSSGADPARFLVEIPPYTTVGEHFVPLANPGFAPLMWVPHRSHIDTPNGQVIPPILISNVSRTNGGLTVTTITNPRTGTSLLPRVLVFDWG